MCAVGAEGTRLTMDVQPTSSSRDTSASLAGEKMDEMGDGRGAGEAPENEEDVCALFATTMPRDVWANPSLAALAALIDEDEEAKQESGEAKQGEKMDDQEPTSSHYAAPRPYQANTTSDNEGAGPSLGAQSSQQNLNIASAKRSSRSSSSSSSTASSARCHRREETIRRRNERRASPYASAAAARRGRGTGGSSGRNGGRGGSTQSQRSGPTPGETQVLMSLWGL
ncbi:unnamed protein product [Hapterophycus canaliculatus]